MGRLPFDQIDVLIVGELGKNYSGAGMDPNVIGRLMVETQADFDRPGRHPAGRARRLGREPRQHRRRRLRRPDDRAARLAGWTPSRSGSTSLTSCCLERARIPITLPTDRDVIETALETCWRIDPAEARMVVIPNTLELNTLWVSPPLEDEVRAHPAPDASRPSTRPIPFSADGTLDQAALFPHSCIRAAEAVEAGRESA